MFSGLRAAFLRLKSSKGFLTSMIAGARRRCDVENVSEDELRAFGLLDERISPSTVKRRFRSEAWAEVDRYQRFP
ncbi:MULTISPECIES: hypothetical protein [unclassified Rhizobium]|uniref:hypothetical protein n=1 Tax=unclassified Rhizobium TaxID=2613769 RepID=UPI001AE55D46|nr:MULTISPECIES: hypothetical protein [unclassified Rhizobium]MBP2461787.1 hypothetical protein [Rhizobium sp. PvP014]MBP2529182.1 hypothetical protein [Rhizobium sp. PvP099]